MLLRLSLPHPKNALCSVNIRDANIAVIENRNPIYVRQRDGQAASPGRSYFAVGIISILVLLMIGFSKTAI